MRNSSGVDLSARAAPWQADEVWGRIRRGWCVGEAPFRGKLEGLLAGVMQGRRRESYGGEIARRNNSVRNGWIKVRLGMGTATNYSTMLKKLEPARAGDWGYAERRKAEIIKI